MPSLVDFFNYPTFFAISFKCPDGWFNLSDLSFIHPDEAMIVMEIRSHFPHIPMDDLCKKIQVPIDPSIDNNCFYVESVDQELLSTHFDIEKMISFKGYSILKGMLISTPPVKFMSKLEWNQLMRDYLALLQHEKNCVATLKEQMKHSHTPVEESGVFCWMTGFTKVAFKLLHVHLELIAPVAFIDRRENKFIIRFKTPLGATRACTYFSNTFISHTRQGFVLGDGSLPLVTCKRLTADQERLEWQSIHESRQPLIKRKHFKFED